MPGYDGAGSYLGHPLIPTIARPYQRSPGQTNHRPVMPRPRSVTTATTPGHTNDSAGHPGDGGVARLDLGGGRGDPGLLHEFAQVSGLIREHHGDHRAARAGPWVAAGTWREALWPGGGAGGTAQPAS